MSKTDVRTEQRVFTWRAHGFTLERIARKLKIHEKTVRNILRRYAAQCTRPR